MKLTISANVTNALRGGRPVVALESTLITHGLPRPENLRVARLLEAAVREEGAEPATIAILGGRITVGLEPAQLEHLAAARDVRKCSRRDLAIATARGEDGATTVAATMWIAHRAGLRVFVTGGIGGVHRGHPFDVSADLAELGRTPVTVVCAGAKAILDLPLTLEVLETHGVPVIGYRTDTFPAFYARDSSLPVTARCDTVEELARLVRERDRLELSAAMLVANPVPEAEALSATEAEEAIREALRLADEEHVAGKDVTPFLLARVSALTGRASQRANVALLLNNARLGAQLAAALTRETP